MSLPPSSFPFGTCGVLAFLATAGIGWNLFSPPAVQPAKGDSSASPETRHSTRPARTAHSVAAEAAAARMGAIRSAANPEARMLASLALADSLDPADFAAWMDGGWFDLRGGPELMMFTKILMDRWKAEDPEGLLAWGQKNGNGAGREVMEEWASKEPQRLLAWFRDHRDDRLEVSMLSKIAGHSPELALQRLREMAEAGMPEDAMRGTRDLMRALAGKSPAALEGMLASLPPDLKLQAESALSRNRLEASFPEEIRNLWDHPDGWRIFSSMAAPAELVKNLMGELSNMPDEWRTLLAANSHQYVMRDAKAWLDLDLEGSGFSSSEARNIRSQAVQALSWQDPALAIEHLGKTEIDPGLRKHILESVFRTNNQENLRELAASLPEEERKIAEGMLGGRVESSSLQADTETTPDDLLEQIVSLDPASVGGGSSFPQLEGWDRTKIEALAKGFGNLPDDRKRLAANFITANAEYNTAPAELQGAALLFLAGQPDAASNGKGKQLESLTAKVSNHATTLSTMNPADAVTWVGSLPAGEARTWAQRNVLSNWMQYDPEAAKAWEKSLSANDRAALDAIAKKKGR